MNNTPATSQNEDQGATTESKSRTGRKGKQANAGRNSPGMDDADRVGRAVQANRSNPLLHGLTEGKFVLFNIPADERVDDGPVMRGFIEITDAGEQGPLKVNVAGWQKTGRENGTPYLSLKIGNNNKDQPEDYSVGPFFGRLFREIEEPKQGGESRVRYFGFVEHAERVGKDADGKGIYKLHWQLRISAKRAKSNDGNTVYVSGSVAPLQAVEVRGNDNLAF